MRLHTVLAILTIAGLFSLILCDSVSSCIKLEKKAEKLQKSYSEKRFIAESFKNTCAGKGFYSLNEWQICCRQMFALDYIAWCEAEDFMIDNSDKKNTVLLYGKWIASEKYPQATGEVYCRVTEGTY